MPSYSHLLDDERDQIAVAEGGWPFDRRHRQGGGAGQIHRVTGVAPKRLAQWPLFAAPRRRSLSTAQTVTANLTPRKCLGFLTPFQAIIKELGKDMQIRFA